MLFCSPGFLYFLLGLLFIHSFNKYLPNKYDAAFNTVARIWKLPKCLTTDEWHICTMEFGEDKEKDEIWKFSEMYLK